MARVKKNNRTKRVRNKKGLKTKRRTKRRTRRNRQRGGKSLGKYMASAGSKIRGSFKNFRERFRRNKNRPESSVEEINRLIGEKRSGKSNGSLYQGMRINANERTAKLRNVEEGSQEMRKGADDFLASARRLRHGISEQ